MKKEMGQTFPCGKAEYCWLSYEPENTVAKELYLSYGFIETSDMDGEEAIYDRIYLGFFV